MVSYSGEKVELVCHDYDVKIKKKHQSGEHKLFSNISTLSSVGSLYLGGENGQWSPPSSRPGLQLTSEGPSYGRQSAWIYPPCFETGNNIMEIIVNMICSLTQD